MTDTVYMKQPEGYNMGTGKVLRLLKALYGAKQSGRIWYYELRTTLINEFGFKQCHSDPCVYYYRKGTSICIIATFVDDIISMDNDPTLKTRLEQVLKEQYDVSSLGHLRWYLQMQLTKNEPEGSITLDQELLIKKLLEKTNMTDCKPATTPAAMEPLTSNMSPQTQEQKEAMKTVPHTAWS